MLKREQSSEVRLQVITIIGILGALDPDRYQVSHSALLFMHTWAHVTQTHVQGIVLRESPPEFINVVPDGELLDIQPSEPEDQYEEKVITLLLDILHQQSFKSHHHLVVDVFISIAKTRGVKFAPVVPKARHQQTLEEFLFGSHFSRLCRPFVTLFVVQHPIYRAIT
jgi:hypothetical protein